MTQPLPRAPRTAERFFFGLTGACAMMTGFFIYQASQRGQVSDIFNAVTTTLVGGLCFWVGRQMQDVRHMTDDTVASVHATRNNMRDAFARMHHRQSATPLQDELIDSNGEIIARGRLTRTRQQPPRA